MPVIPLRHDMISLEICFIQSAPFIPTVYIQITLNPVAQEGIPDLPIQLLWSRVVLALNSYLCAFYFPVTP